VTAHGFHKLGIERHKAEGTAVILKNLKNAMNQHGTPVPVALEFDQERHSSFDLMKKLGQCRDGFGGMPQSNFLKLGGGAANHRSCRRGEPVQCPVVKHHRLAITGKLQVAFDGIIGGHGCSKRSHGVFDYAGIDIVQPAMGDRPCDEPVEFLQSKR
jgi:hypothetical protein